MSNLGELSGMYIYPIKSLCGIYLQKAFMTKNGIAHPDNINVVDRKWMIVDEKGSFLSQRKLPRMALIKQRYEDNFLILSAPGMHEIKVSVDVPLKQKECRLWTVSIVCYTYDTEIGKWLSDFLMVNNLDLVNFGDSLEQRNDADFSRFMLVSEASLEELNARLDKKVSMRNFRPNLIVKNCSAFEEDNWKKFKIGECEFNKTGFCIRCLFTTVDPDEGIKCPNQQPFQTLKQYRMNEQVDKHGPLFGIYLDLAHKQNLVSSGDLIIAC